MDLKTVQTVEIAGGIGILTLNRPDRRNAISIEMRLEILECMRKWKESQTVGVMIITGSGDAFSAGFDLTEFNHPERFSDIFETSSRYHRELWNFPKPTIAAVNGAALAGGFDLAKLCDIRICSPKAVFGHPEIKFGIPPLVTPLRWIIGAGPGQAPVPDGQAGRGRGGLPHRAGQRGRRGGKTPGAGGENRHGDHGNADGGASPDQAAHDRVLGPRLRGILLPGARPGVPGIPAEEGIGEHEGKIGDR